MSTVSPMLTSLARSMNTACAFPYEALPSGIFLFSELPDPGDSLAKFHRQLSAHLILTKSILKINFDILRLNIFNDKNGMFVFSTKRSYAIIFVLS